MLSFKKDEDFISKFHSVAACVPVYDSMMRIIQLAAAYSGPTDPHGKPTNIHPIYLVLTVMLVKSPQTPALFSALILTTILFLRIFPVKYALPGRTIAAGLPVIFT